MEHGNPLRLNRVVKLYKGMIVLAQLGKSKGDVRFYLVRLMPPVPRFMAGFIPAEAMSLTHMERICAVGDGFKCKLTCLLSLGTGRHIEPEYNRKACQSWMTCIARRVAAGMAAAVCVKAAKDAEELCATKQYDEALVLSQIAADFGHLPSRAFKAWMLIVGREGVAQDRLKAFELVEEGASLGCHHCQGVLAWCYWGGWGCQKDEARSLELACDSSGKGSRYGQCILGMLYEFSKGGIARDSAQALALYRLAAEQNFDEAQCSLGSIYDIGQGVAQDLTEALRWYRLAAAQGHPQALYKLACCHEEGRGVRRNKAEAIRLYRRALDAGNRHAAEALQELRA